MLIRSNSESTNIFHQFFPEDANICESFQPDKGSLSCCLSFEYFSKFKIDSEMYTGSSPLMRISLLQILLMRFFKTITYYNFANAILWDGTIYFVSAFIS